MEGHGEQQGVRGFEAAGSSPSLRRASRVRETTAEVYEDTLRRSTVLRLPVEKLAKGVYGVLVSDSASHRTKKLIIQ